MFNNLYKFTAYNSQALYGWGTEVEADQYADHLNRDREINVYGYQLITDPEEITKVSDYGSGINMEDELQAIDDAK